MGRRTTMVRTPDVVGETSREAPRGVKDLRSITESGGRLGGPESMGN